MSDAAYFADKYHVSNSMLSDLMRSPRLFEAKHVTMMLDDTPSASMVLGTAFHKLVLEPDEFAESYTTNPHDGRTKAGREFKKNLPPGVTCLSTTDMATLYAMERSMKRSSCNPYLEAEGDVEKEIRWTCEDTGVPCKAKLDKVFPDSRLVVDIKTTKELGYGVDDFAKSASNFGYHRQAAGYIDAACAEYGGHRCEWTFAFLVVETTGLLRSRSYLAVVETLEVGYREREELLSEYKRRQTIDDWSEKGEGSSYELRLPKWHKEYDADE